MPFQLVPIAKAAELFAKKGNFRMIKYLFPLGTWEYSPDCWTEGIGVVVAEINSEKVIAYWASCQFGGYWAFIDERRSEQPYLFKRRSAAKKRMDKAGEIVDLRPGNEPHREGRIAVWRAGDHLNLPEYRQISGKRFPGSITR